MTTKDSTPGILIPPLADCAGPRLPAALHEQLRTAAFLHRKTMAAIVREALELWLQTNPAGADDAHRTG